MNLQVTAEVFFGPSQPVIEITGNNQRCVMRDMRFDPFDQGGKLPLPFESKQAQVNTDDVYMLSRFGYLDGAMQQAAAGTLETRQVEIVPFRDQVLAQYGVAVMSLFIDRVFTIGVMRPDTVRQEFELAYIGPGRNLGFMVKVASLNFLQQHDIDLGIV